MKLDCFDSSRWCLMFGSLSLQCVLDEWIERRIRLAEEEISRRVNSCSKVGRVRAWVNNTAAEQHRHENLATPPLCAIGLRLLKKQPPRRGDHTPAHQANSEQTDCRYSIDSLRCGEPVAAVRIVGAGADHSERLAGLGYRHRSDRSGIQRMVRHIQQQPHTNAERWGFNHSDSFRADHGYNILFRCDCVQRRRN